MRPDGVLDLTRNGDHKDWDCYAEAEFGLQVAETRKKEFWSRVRADLYVATCVIIFLSSLQQYVTEGPVAPAFAITFLIASVYCIFLNMEPSGGGGGDGFVSSPVIGD